MLYIRTLCCGVRGVKHIEYIIKKNKQRPIFKILIKILINTSTLCQTTSQHPIVNSFPRTLHPCVLFLT